MKYTYIAFATFLIFVGAFYLVTHSRIHPVDNNWVTCGEGFFYNLETASEADWYNLEKEADKCSGRWGILDYQGRRVLDTPTQYKNPGEFDSIWSSKIVGNRMYTEAVIVYSKGEPTLLVVDWKLTPDAHRSVLREALGE